MVALRWIASRRAMSPERHGFQTLLAYSRWGLTKDVYSSLDDLTLKFEKVRRSRPRAAFAFEQAAATCWLAFRSLVMITPKSRSDVVLLIGSVELPLLMV